MISEMIEIEDINEDIKENIKEDVKEVQAIMMINYKYTFKC